MYAEPLAFDIALLRIVIIAKCLTAIAVIIAAPTFSRAQFWHAMPHVDTNNTLSACFSNGEKKVFYLSKDGGIANIWGMTIADKYGGIIAGPANHPEQITKFTSQGIVRFFHLLDLPEILYMRLAADGQDYHIYRIKDDGSSEPEDLTPDPEGVTSEIIGASYNGRYVYFTNNKVSRDKVDVYRYDTQQLTSDLIFPNDKNYVALAWTRDQQKLLIEDPSNRSYSIYDIETTERTPLNNSAVKNAVAATLDPTYPGGEKLEAFSYAVNKNAANFNGLDSNKLNDHGDNGILETDYSPNCKYLITHYPGMWKVKNISTGSELPLPKDTLLLSISPKETLLLYSLPASGNASKIFLYDIAKKSSTELATVH